MKVSVVVPAYNEEKFIGACLDSLMQQEEQPDEIIVVNNNSVDNTVKIAKTYPVRIVTEKEQGMIPARNRGFNEASYEIIARTDSDTIVPPNWIKRIKRAFQDNKLIALSGPAYFYDLPEVMQSNELSTKALFSYAFLLKRILKHDILYGPNMALRKVAWEKIKNSVCLNDKEVHEDIDLASHLATLGKVKFDSSFVVDSSFRRWKKIESYFDYTYRGINGIRKHKPLMKHTKGASGPEFIKKLVYRTLDIPVR